MLRYLLDENISPVVADGVSKKNAQVSIATVSRWRSGKLMGASDSEILFAAAEDALTMVTYDLRTIPGLLARWADADISHAGVLLVDERSIRPSDFGRLIRALTDFWIDHHRMNWRNRISYLAGM